MAKKQLGKQAAQAAENDSLKSRLGRMTDFRLLLPLSVQGFLASQRSGFQLFILMATPLLLPLVLYGGLREVESFFFLSLFMISAFVFSGTLPGSRLFPELSLSILPSSSKGVRVHFVASLVLMLITGLHYLKVAGSIAEASEHLGELLFVFFAILPALSTANSVFGLWLTMMGSFLFISVAPVIFVATQTGSYFPGLFFFGYFIACFYVALLLIEHDNLLKEQGFRRFENAHSGKRGDYLRPKGSSILLAVFILFMPALVIALTSLGKLPWWMMLTVIPIPPAAAICNAYTSSSQTNETLTVAIAELLLIAFALLMSGALILH
ncbi:MAG: hypothetical protein PHC51_00055 [bacterium]|nr:hypothetical protein [bacterium]